MKIKGWEKISGYTYKGYSIINPIHNAQETKYDATILNLNLPHKPKWEISVLSPLHKFRTGVNRNTDTFFITMWADNNFNTSREITKERMKSITNFRNEFEEMVDTILGAQLTSAPRSSSMYYSNSNGIVNHINNNGTTIPYGQIVQSIQSMQQTITNLTKTK